MEEQGYLSNAEEVLEYPMLHLTSRPDAWRHWINSAGISGVSAMQGARYEHFSILISAACAGLGIDLIPRYLLTQELERKELTMAHNLPVESDAAYDLIYPEENAFSSVLNHFRYWLLDEVSSFQK